MAGDPVPRRARGKRFDWPLWGGATAIVLWLWYACSAFTGEPFRRWPDSPAFALWFAAAAAVLVAVLRLGLRAARSARPDQPLEILRWLAMAGAGFALMLPYYGRRGIGSGDAYWYVVMLADFTAQLRHGVFPVWIGQSEYAFNGAVSPLRLAPWFQLSGGFLDLVTAHRLEPLALKNALLCVSALGTAASAYLCLGAVLPRRPGLACLLALLWLASPSTLAPLATGSLYMQFMALPFLPPLLLGCWRLWARDDNIARLLIGSALAGLMLSHTPTALWGGLLAGGMVLGQAVARRDWARAARRTAGMAGLFLVLGGWPIGSALTIDNPVRPPIGPIQAPSGIAKAFPANLLPFRTGGDLQVGAALLGVAVLALVLLAWLRPRGGIAFAAALAAVVALTFPVPWLTARIWTHLPRLLLWINNSSPTGRLFEFLGLLAAFALALAAADDRISRRTWPTTLLLVALAGGGAWSAREVAKIVREADSTATDAGPANAYLRPENLALPRFAYASFAAVPGYASHAHMEPLWENRLLDRATGRVLTANADAAAPRVHPDREPETLPRLVRSGVLVATSADHGSVYRLTPQFRLEPGRRYALRLDFLHPETPGQLQFKHADLFRDYLLPDSGQGLGGRLEPRAFGALPTSSGVAALEQRSPVPIEAQQLLVLGKYAGERFDFARFWLFSYEPKDLPIRILSWIPYQAETETAVPAWLETPRVWQRGWQAEVNGRPAATRPSPQNLVMVPIEPGPNQVILTFHPPIWLSTWFWLGLTGWIVLLGFAALQVAQRDQGPIRSRSAGRTD